MERRSNDSAIDIPLASAWCDQLGCDPAERGSRAGYAAELSQAGHAVPWPPGRNRACWCGSGRKYKHCCRTAARTR
ncbi:MAG: SEC-C metal-binding domain-containing protein [Nocardioidaceae bacterium]